MKKLILILIALMALLTLAQKAYADMGEDAFKLQAYVEEAGKVGNICSVSLSLGMARTRLCDTFNILDHHIRAIAAKYDNRPEKNKFYTLVQQAGGAVYEKHKNRYLKVRADLQALGE